MDYRKLTFQMFMGLLAIIAVVMTAYQPCLASVDPFPHYPSLKNNVEFWKKVYTEHPSSKGFIHDSRKLEIIYEVVQLVDREKPGADKINRDRTKKAKEKYRDILIKLAKGSPASSSEEKRVLALWGGDASKNDLLTAADNVRFQHCIKEKFQAGLQRSGRYIEEMKNIIRQHGLPVDLVYLPHVESSFNYDAYSKFGAAGIWQFIRSTGSRFLTINYVVDERRNPLKATQAAARYLKENFERLGSWPLALTAYNHGANGMLRAKNEIGGFEEIVEKYKSRSFGFASRNFYAQFLAAREVAKDYRKYFQDIVIEPPLAVQEVKLKGYMAMADLVDYLGVEPTVIRSLNPGLRKPVYEGQKYVPAGYNLHLPKSAEIVSLANSIPDRLMKKEQARSRFYQVRRGDTAGGIARMHRIKLKDLIGSNNLGRKAQIYVGQNLIIPQKGEKVVRTANRADKAVKKTLAPDKVVEKGNKTVEKVTLIVPNAGKVKKAEPVLLASISKTEAATTIALLAEPLTSAQKNLPEDDVLLEEDNNPTDKAAEPAAAPLQVFANAIIGDFLVKKVVTVKGANVGLIKVEAWETLGHYADWLEVPTSQIRRLNNFSMARPIQTNQEIKIPLAKVDKELFEERRYEFHKEIEEDFFAAFRVVESQTYKVKKGDNIWQLCREELDLPFWLVKKYNASISFDNLRPDQLIVVPVVEKI